MSTDPTEARIAAPSKSCSRCGQERTRDQFYAHPKTADGLGAWCKPCYAATYKAEKPERLARQKARREADLPTALIYVRAANKKHYAKNRAAILGKRYGVSAEQHTEMVRRAKGRCSICNEPPTKQGLCVDHDHTTGAVRGLLCAKCNAALGQFNDDPARLASAIVYLAQHQADGSSLGSPRECLDEQASVQVNPI